MFIACVEKPGRTSTTRAELAAVFGSPTNDPTGKLTINAAPPYESVSYCWGDTSVKTTVAVENAPVEVPQTAASALHRLRSPDFARTLWIDALCIDQRNVEERSHQVADMHSIYRNATLNLVWLGQDENGRMDRAFTTMKTVLAEAAVQTADFAKFATTVSDADGNIQTSMSGLATDIDLRPILELFQRPYFRRLWVVQEAALSSKSVCFCGPHEVLLIDILRAATFLYFKRNFVAVDFRFNKGIYSATTVWSLMHRELTTTDRQRLRLSPLLRKLQRFKTHDPRDHVYGVLGLYKQHSGIKLLSPLLEPDYNKSLEHVLRDAARFCMTEQNDLEPLNKVAHWIEGTNEQTPSWVPRWDRRWNPGKDTSCLVTHFRASGSSRVHISTPDIGGEDVLSVLGIFVAGPDNSRVVVISQSYADIDHAHLFLNEALQLMSGAKALGESGEDVALALVTTLLGDRTLESDPVSERDVEEFKALQQHISTFGKRPPSYRSMNVGVIDANANAMGAARFLSAIWRACKLRRFFVTESGHMGIGPPTMATGDSVVILYGGYTPFILRAQGDEYRFIGESYVHGMMQGEAVDRYCREGDQDVEFHIR